MSKSILFLEMLRERNTKHGMSKTRFYGIWQAMIKRCGEKNTNTYERYRGRGIVVRARWEKFENFREDMLEGYSDNLSIDRIDNDGNYCKENCRWATVEEQANNKRNNVKIVYKGVTVSLHELSDLTGIAVRTLWYRVKNGFPEDKLGQPAFSHRTYKPSKRWDEAYGNKRSLVARDREGKFTSRA